MKIRSFAFLFGFCFLPLLEAEPPVSSVITIPSRGPTGGGWSDAGAMGEYFVGNKLEGIPAFTRREVRIDFDWGTVLPVGGSSAEPYKSFPHDNFSARWTGKVIPRFSEPYTFTVMSDGKPTLSIKDLETGKRKEIPLKINADKKFVCRSVALNAGHPAEIVLEYHHGIGAAYCSLSWSSPSTPLEIINPVIEQGLNIASFDAVLWADLNRCRRWVNSTWGPAAQDENGQLSVSDGSFMMFESSEPNTGNYQISFTGYADLQLVAFNGIGKFVVDGKEYEKLPAKGPGYDEKSNTTRVLVKVFGLPRGNHLISFKNAFRDAPGTQPGVSNFHCMRPSQDKSSTPCAADAVVYPPIRQDASYFTCLRYLDVANCRTTPLWKDRTPATYAGFKRGADKEKNRGTGGENWESLIILANESGRDLYFTLPVNADDEYLHKLALLVRYGSDGMEPYPQPTANPKFPPLNSNLHFYFEVGNEIWNWAFASTFVGFDASKDGIAQKTEDGLINNYDGKGHYRRYVAIRTVKASNAFRQVFGDAAMNNRIRPLLMFQYADAQETAKQSFYFIDHYYNNGTGENVKEPHAIPYYIFGGGGAAYYGVGNGEGKQDAIVCKDPSFEGVAVGDGEKVTPKEGAWTFTGNAGVYRNYSSAVLSYESVNRIVQPAKMAIGIRFTTGDKPLWVYKLGRVYTGGSDKGARLSILKASDLSVVAKAETGRIQTFVAPILGYYWGEFSDKKPVSLDAKTDYLLVSQDLAGTQYIEGFDTPVKVGNGISGVKAVKVKIVDPENTKGWLVENGADNCCPGPVTMLFSEKADVVTDLPQPHDGIQAAYIHATGEISQQVNFTKAGSFAVELNAVQSQAAKGQKSTPFQLYFDDQNISAGSQNHLITGDTFGLGGFDRVNGIKENWGSMVFKVDKPGLHTLRLVGAGKESENPTSAIFDNIRITSADALLDSGFGGGSACGQPAEKAWDKSQSKDSSIVCSLGLPRVSYETGWSLGGDFQQIPIQTWCKLFEDRAGVVNDKTTEIWRKTGGFLPVWGVYVYWEDCEHVDTYPIVKSFIKASQQLPAEPDNGATLPAELNGKNIKFGNDNLQNVGNLMCWTFICPETGVYKVSVDTAAGGKFNVDVDGESLGPVVDGGSPCTYLIKAAKGIHGVLIRCKKATVPLHSITIAAQKQLI